MATFPALAEPDSSAVPKLTLAAAAERVMRQNPELQASEFARQVAASRIADAEFRPQWSVSLELEDFAGSGVLSELDGGEATLRLSRIFQPGAKRTARVATASARADEVENGLDSRRLDLMARLATRFVDVVYLQERLRLADASVEVFERARSLALSSERAGAAPAVDRLRTEMRLSNAELAREGAEHELHAARRALAATWGDDTDEFGKASASLCQLQELPPYTALVDRIDRNPDILRFATQQRVREAEAQLAAARQRPDWTLTAGVRRLEFIDDQALVFSVSVPFGSRSRAAPALRRAEALGSESRLQEAAAMNETRAILFDLYEETRHTIREVRVLDTEILPRASEIRNLVQTGYGLGRFSHTELVNAEADLIAAASARVDACRSHHRLLISIERLTGGLPVEAESERKETQ